MQVLEFRVNSFRDTEVPWPHDENNKKIANPRRLAMSGFYFSPVVPKDRARHFPSDMVTCYLCKAATSEWKEGENPLDRHFYIFNECPLVVVLKKLGNNKILTTARRKTFSNWWPFKGKDVLASPQALAAAGFYYFPLYDRLDNVRCVDCGMDFYGWEPDDDPAVVHKSESPLCPFVFEYLSTVNAPPSENGQRKLMKMASAESDVVNSIAGKQELVKQIAFPEPKRSPAKKDLMEGQINNTKTESPLRQNQKRSKLKEIDDGSAKKPKFASKSKELISSVIVKPATKGMQPLDDDFQVYSNNVHGTSNKNRPALLTSHSYDQTIDNSFSKAENEQAAQKVKELSEQLKQKEDDIRDLRRQMEETLKIKDTEIDGLKTQIEKATSSYKDELDAWKKSWRYLKDENDLYQPMFFSKIQHLKGLSPDMRRSYYLGELLLFEIRTGLTPLEYDGQIAFDSTVQAFFSMADIPWPVYPTDAINDENVTKFLFEGNISPRDKIAYAHKVCDTFKKSSFTRWSVFVEAKDRDQVYAKSKSLYNVLHKMVGLWSSNV